MVSWLDYCSIFVVLIPILAGLYNYKTLSSYLRLFTFFLIFGFLLDLISSYLAINGKNNIWLMNIYLLFELPVLLYISLGISGLLKSLKYYLVFITFFIFLWIWRLLFSSAIFEFSNIVNSVVYFTMVLAAGFSLIRISERSQVNIFSNPAFWLNAGFIIYFSGSMAIFSLANQMLHASDEIMNKAWEVHEVFILISYIIYTIALVCKSRRLTA